MIERWGVGLVDPMVSVSLPRFARDTIQAATGLPV
jgi:hypothetical protein